MREWDIASLERKFGGSYAYCQVASDFPSWKYIYSVGETGIIKYKALSGKKEYAIATADSTEGLDKQDLPEIKFFYKPVKSGWVSASGPSVLIVRTHIKSYLIGIGRENYEFNFDDRPMDTLGIDPNVDGVVSPHKDVTIFNRSLWRFGNSLRFLNMEIGFLENKTCVLNNLLFTTLVKKVMGETWTIKHCN